MQKEKRKKFKRPATIIEVFAVVGAVICIFICVWFCIFGIKLIHNKNLLKNGEEKTATYVTTYYSGGGNMGIKPHSYYAKYYCEEEGKEYWGLSTTAFKDIEEARELLGQEIKIKVNEKGNSISTEYQAKASTPYFLLSALMLVLLSGLTFVIVLEEIKRIKKLKDIAKFLEKRKNRRKLKMKYYELGANTPGISIEEDIFHIKTKELKCGVDLSGQDIDKKIVIYPKHISITDWSTLHAFIVTERFKKIIQSANCGNIQFLPFVAKREDGKEEHELYIVNYIDRFDALVREHSKIIPKIFDFEEDYIVIACVDESKLGDLDIFTLKGDNENVYVSERLQKIIEENKLTGVDLKKIRTLAKETKAQNVEKVTQKPIKINNKPINSFEELLDMALAQTPKKVIGFCVNLYEGENNNFYAELVATNSFGSQNEDWACDEIFASREDNMEYEFISNNYETALDKIKTELVKYLASGKYSKKLKQAKGIAYGFVDGDLTLIYER